LLPDWQKKDNSGYPAWRVTRLTTVFTGVR